MVHKEKAKWISLALVTIMLTVLLVACGGNSATPASTPDSKTTAPQGKVKLQWMSWGTPDPINVAIEALFAAFPDLKDKVEFEVVIGGAGDANVAEKLRLGLAANEKLPDILQFNRIQIPEFATAGVLADVSKVYDDKKDSVFPAILDLVSYDGKQVAFPVEAKTKVWFYRKDMFDEAGIDPTKIKNLQEFIDAGKKLNAKFPNSYIWNMPKNFGGNFGYYLGMILSGNGGKFWDSDKEKYVVDSDPGVRKAFEAFKQIMDANITVDIGDFTTDWEKGFADSTIASTILANWLKDKLPVYAPELAGKWAAAEWPIIGDSDGGSENGGGLYVITDKSPNKELATEVLTKLTLTKEGRIAWYNSAAKRFPTVKDAANDPQVQKPHPYFGETLPKIETKVLEKFKVFPYTPSSMLEFNIVNGYLTKYINNELSLDEALKKAQRDMETQIGNPFN